MTEFYQQILLLASLPIYLLLIPLEIVLSNIHGWKFYSWKETAVNVYLNLVNAGVDLLLRAFALLVLVYFYSIGPELSYPPWAYWLLLFLAEDLMFWLEHFVDHKVRFFWAVHVTHHSSEEYNLTTGFRSSVFMPFYRYLYFIPLALLHFRPVDILFMYAITQIYGILVHTQAVKKLPRWVGWLLVTPAHHRVHHASNIPYLDKNMGMVLIVWDRMFGTFTDELPEEPPRFGLTKPIERPFHPTHIIFHEWQALFKDLKEAPGIKNKLRYLFMPPGWRHDGNSQTTRHLQEKGRRR